MYKKQSGYCYNYAQRMVWALSLFIMTIFSTPLMAQFAGGSGTEADPYQISTPAQLDSVRHHLDKHFILINDIDLDVAPYNTGEGWEPIGDTLNGFTGVLNGNDFEITGLFIDRPISWIVGLFGMIGDENLDSENKADTSSVLNLNILNANVTGFTNVGILSGFNFKGTVANNSSSGVVHAVEATVGGLLGSNGGIVSNCFSTATVSFDGETGSDELIAAGGGLVGANFFGGTISDSYSTGDVTGNVGVGGFVGYNDEGSSIENSYSTGSVKATSYFGIAGGFVGWNIGELSTNYTSSSVDGGYSVGGFAGANGGNIENNYSLGDVKGIDAVGGFVGLNGVENEEGTVITGSVTNSYSTGGINSSGDDIGGFVGINDAIIINSYWNMETSGMNTSPSGIGLSSSQMRDSTVFANWDFDNVWNITLGISFPWLRSVEESPKPGANGLNLSGSGTIDDPFKISNLNDLKWLSENSQYWGSNFIQTADIDASSTLYWNYTVGFKEIGNIDTAFTGRYDGQNYEITNLYSWSYENISYSGFFGRAIGAEITNLKLDFYTTGGNQYVGLIGYGDSLLIDNVSVTGLLYGSYYVGGIVGFIENSSISNSTANINIIASERYLGGIAGRTENTIVINSSTYGTILNASEYGPYVVGGLIGGGYYNSKILNCFSSVDVAGLNWIGGLVGYINSSNIDSTYSQGRVTGEWQVGGLVGMIASSSKISNSISTSKVIGEANVGGLIGVNYTGSEINTSFSTGEVQGDIDVGSFVGYNANSTIIESYSTGKISAETNPAGFIGYNEEGIVTNSYWNTETTKQSQGISYNDNGAVSEGLSNNEMIINTNFTGFDFQNDWDIYQGYSFPFLRGVGDHVASVLQITGNEGWRLLTSPLDSMSYGALLDSLWTQGFTGADTETGTSNVYTWDDATRNWQTISNAEDVPAPGTGILVYVYDDQNFDGTDEGFPKTMVVQGSQSFEDETVALSLTKTGAGYSYVPNDDGWNFIGNPFAHPINWDEAAGWTKTGLDGAIYIWNDTDNEYQSWNGTTGTLPNDGIIAPFQGFWVKANNTGAPAITIKPEAKSSGGALLKEKVQPKFELVLQAGEESSKALFSFNEEATEEKDDLDTWKLMPLSNEYISVYSKLEDGSALDINALPVNLSEPLEIDLGTEVVLSEMPESLGFSWDVSSLPEEWNVTLTDTKTGQVTDLRNADSYSFQPDHKQKIVIQDDFRAPLHTTFAPTVQKGKSTETTRFKVTIYPGGIINPVEEAHLPKQFALSQNYPNPFNPSTLINYQLPENSVVDLRVFDMLGREVANLVSGQVEAGYHQVLFDARNLASGVYIYRFKAGSNVFTKKLTLIK